METTYRVLIKGVKPSSNAKLVITNMAKLFKISIEDAERVLEADVHVVKGCLPLSKAAQYHTAIEAAGANCIVEPEMKSESDDISNACNDNGFTSENAMRNDQRIYKATSFDGNTNSDDTEKTPPGFTANENMKGCDTCKKTISVLASVCPACGAPNEWIHPSIKTFISNKDNIATSKPFGFQWNKTEVWGETKPKLPWWIWLVFILTAPVSFMGSFLIGMVVSVICGAVVFSIFGKQSKFRANLLKCTWESSDDQFWEPVRSALNLL